MKLLNLVSIISLLLFMSIASAAPRRVWIDYDLSFGKYLNEVDDGLALIHALLAMSEDKFEIVGISTGHGNTFDMAHQMKWSKKLLKALGREDIQVFPGAAYPQALGSMGPASIGMIDALEEGPLTIMAMGRMTNVASTLLIRPELAPMIEELIINAGRRLEYSTRVGRRGIIFPDTNVDGAPRAMEIIVNFGINLTMIPTESMTDSLITKEHLRRLKRTNSLLGKWLFRYGWPWRILWSIYPGTRGFIPWDVFIVSYLTNPQDFTCERDIPYTVKYMKNDASAIFRKKYRKTHKDFLVVSNHLESSARGTYCFDIDEDHVQKIITLWEQKLSSVPGDKTK